MFQNFLSTTVLVIMFCCISNNALAQDTLISQSESFISRRQVCLNLSPLAMQFVPFNRSDPRLTGPYLTCFKWANASSQTALRISLGINVDNANNNETQTFNLGIGWDRRRDINKKWSHTRGMEFILWVGDLNIPGQPDINNNDRLLVGAAPLWGIEYALSNHVTLGTEAQMVIGTDPDNGFVFTIIPPVGLFLHYYFK